MKVEVLVLEVSEQGDREVRASAGMDYFVRKDAQGRGLGIALSDMRHAPDPRILVEVGLVRVANRI